MNKETNNFRHDNVHRDENNVYREENRTVKTRTEM